MAIVLQQLTEEVNLVPLFMSTAIRSVTLYKGLISFMNGILIRLISKRIWTVPAMWEGYIRLCTVSRFQLKMLICQDWVPWIYLSYIVTTKSSSSRCYDKFFPITN